MRYLQAISLTCITLHFTPYDVYRKSLICIQRSRLMLKPAGPMLLVEHQGQRARTSLQRHEHPHMVPMAAAALTPAACAYVWRQNLTQEHGVKSPMLLFFLIEAAPRGVRNFPTLTRFTAERRRPGDRRS